MKPQNVAFLLVVGGAIAGLFVVGLFVRGPHWIVALSAIAFGYGGGYLGAQVYKRIYCAIPTR